MQKGFVLTASNEIVTALSDPNSIAINNL